MFARRSMYALAMLVVFAGDAQSQSGPLSLEGALALAREKAPAVAAARGELARAKAEVIAASMRLDNPEIDGSAGPRFSDGAERQFDFGAGISQQFESGSRRRARIAAANEGVASAEASVMVAQREVLREASLAFFDAQFLRRQQALLLDAIRIASEAQQIAERRFALGDVAALDVNTARVERARLQAEALAVDAEKQAALGSLGALLGAPELPSVNEAEPTVQEQNLEVLVRALESRPELRAIDASIRQAQARLELASAFKRPTLGAMARYERDEGDHVLLGGLTVTLAVFNKGQDINAEASARIESLRLQRSALAASWAVVLRARVLGLQAHRRAIEVIEREALPAALDNEGLARRSYETGQISLIDWMVLRREALQVRREHLARLRDAAIATIELNAAAGVIQ